MDLIQVPKMQKSELKKLIQSLIAWPYYVRAIGLKDQMFFGGSIPVSDVIASSISFDIWFDC